MFSNHEYEHHLVGWHQHMLNIHTLSGRFRDIPFEYDRYDWDNKGYAAWDDASYVWKVLLEADTTVRSYWQIVDKLAYFRRHLSLQGIYDAIHNNVSDKEAAYYAFTAQTLSYIQKDMFRAVHWQDHFDDAMMIADEFQKLYPIAA